MDTEFSVQKQDCTSYNQKFAAILTSREEAGVIYTDNSLDFTGACDDLSWKHDKSTPHRSETNGIAERALTRVKERTSTPSVTSGLDEQWWREAMECYCYMRNIQDLPADGKTLCERKYDTPFRGAVIFLEKYL